MAMWETFERGDHPVVGWEYLVQLCTGRVDIALYDEEEEDDLIVRGFWENDSGNFDKMDVVKFIHVEKVKEMLDKLEDKGGE